MHLKELRSLLGIGSYYRKYIKGYAAMVKPLTRLTHSEEGKGKISRRKSKFVMVKWDDKCEKAFNELKKGITEAPVLTLAKTGVPFILETDSSDKGLGTVLSQRVDGTTKVIIFASRSISRGEQNKANYSLTKLELLAIVWAVSTKFRHYLMGAKCTVFTDNSAVAYINRKTDLIALEQRWMGRLAPFDIDIKYKAGGLNTIADALSRKRVSQEDKENIMDDDSHP